MELCDVLYHVGAVLGMAMHLGRVYLPHPVLYFLFISISC